jgi:hypothetical protein
MPGQDQIYWTWNFFLTVFLVPLGLGLLWIAIKRQFTTRDKKDEAISKLLEEREAEKEAHIRERWATFQQTQCAIKEKLDDVSKDLNNKVDWAFCHDKETEISRKLDRLDDRMRT